MFKYKEINFKELCALEKGPYLESTLYIYEKSNNKIFEIFYNISPVGILILGKDKNNISIAYFQIFKLKRKIGLGKNFVLQFINILKTIENIRMVYLTSLSESISFWSKCGFIQDEKCKEVMYYKL